MDDDRDDESHENIKKSGVWKHFEIANDRDRTATCNICFKLLSYRTSITNLKKHLARKHGDDEDMLSKISDDEGETIEELETYLEDAGSETDTMKGSEIYKKPYERSKSSAVWEHFTVKDNVKKIATCKVCDHTLSYLSTTSNLKKHWSNKHCVQKERVTRVVDDDETDCENWGTDTENVIPNDRRRRNSSVAWRHFTIQDSVKCIAKCNLCAKSLSYLTTRTNLVRHFRNKHGGQKKKDTHDDDETECENSGTETQNVTHPKDRSKIGAVWEHFTITDPVKKIAKCNVCHNSFSYYSTTANLMNHFRRFHGVQKGKEDDSSSSENETENVTHLNDRKKTRRRKNLVWEHFTIENPVKKIAKCNVCHNSFSYFTTTANLMNHTIVAHGVQKGKEDDSSSENETENVTDQKDRSKIGAVWEHFTIIDPVKKIAKCNVCNQSFSYLSTTANLMNHFRRFHGVQKEKDDDSSSSENETENVTHSNDRRKKGVVWEHFTIKDSVKKIAKCKVCHKSFSYFSTTANLMNHLRRIHGVQKGKEDDSSSSENETENVTHSKDRSKIGAVWEHFTIENPVKKIAKCNVCHNSFSYFSTTANLMNHFRRFHGVQKEKEDDSSSENETENVTHSKDRRKKGAVWEHFTIENPVKKIAKCNVCHNSFSYFTTTANLMNHTIRAHGVQKEKQDGRNDDMESEKNESNKRSPIWLYFKCIDKVAKISVCLICKRQLSHLTSITNLKKHLYRKHPGVKLKDMHDGKKMLIASDGQLYEIEDETKVETLEIDDDNNDDDDHQSEEPIELNAIYLDDYEGTVIEPNRKRKPSTSKRKRLIAENNDSSEGELTYQKQYTKKTSDSLDQFGKYLVSLLRQLPKELSNQLQADFVKQVMTSQLTYQSQNVVVAPSNGYSITITEAVPKGNNDAYISTEGNDVSQSQ
ncbi:uncharacterized protein LOC135085974 isoform X1 [Ostrinia nubilalis]|uniref:uncharacterized protein LOC135085974 isoform X1 n=1 Tax=Ostrinia nubilalis TaxID=29057 RepID=UPI003082391E